MMKKESAMMKKDHSIDDTMMKKDDGMVKNDDSFEGGVYINDNAM